METPTADLDLQSLFSKEIICSYLKTNTPLTIDIYSAITSTNDQAMLMAEQGCASGTLILAEEQTNGRGRHGKQFFSPKQKGIYMSMVLRPQQSIQNALLITTAAAVAVALAIEKVSGKKAQIKWVNDVYVDGKKVCGILTEGVFSQATNSFDAIILGIGINLFPPQSGFPQELEQKAISLWTQEDAVLANKLVAEVWNYFFEFYDQLEQNIHWAEYASRMFLIGKKITVIQGAKDEHAQALQLDKDFRLLVRFENGTERWLTNGEVSLRI